MMSLEQKKAYLETIRKRYKKATKKQKAIILDEFCSVCEYNRKYAVRLLRKKQKKNGRRPGRKPKYDVLNIMKPLKAIWFACDQACSKKLKIIIREWLPYYEFEQGLLDDLVRGQLYSISPSTIDRILKPVRMSIGVLKGLFPNSRKYRDQKTAKTKYQSTSPACVLSPSNPFS